MPILSPPHSLYSTPGVHFSEVCGVWLEVVGIPIHPKPTLWVSTWLADQGGRSPLQKYLHPSGVGPPTAVHSSRG